MKCDPVIVVASTAHKARTWANQNIKASERQPVCIDDSLSRMRGMRDYVVLILWDAVIPLDAQYRLDKNTVIRIQESMHD